MTDIFEFWTKIKRGAHIHPADQDAFLRINPERHGFRLDCIPACYVGKLRTAPVVLLYLSPGFDQQDLNNAMSNKGKDYYKECWTGNAPLPNHPWFKSRTKCFGDYECVRDKVAVLNIGAYHSTDAKSYASLLALPSSRVSISWAQEVLFPQAEAGERIVICMRSAPYWGLETGKSYGRSLFAPHVNRSGHLLKNADNQEIIKAVRSVIRE